MCCLIIVRCGQGGWKSFHKDSKDWQERKHFVFMDSIRRVSEDSSDFMAQRPKTSSSRPQVSPKLVGNERTKIEALLVARFDAEDLADERSTS